MSPVLNEKHISKKNHWLNELLILLKFYKTIQSKLTGKNWNSFSLLESSFVSLCGTKGSFCCANPALTAMEIQTPNACTGQKTTYFNNISTLKLVRLTWIEGITLQAIPHIFVPELKPWCSVLAAGFWYILRPLLRENNKKTRKFLKVLIFIMDRALADWKFQRGWVLKTPFFSRQHVFGSCMASAVNSPSCQPWTTRIDVILLIKELWRLWIQL